MALAGCQRAEPRPLAALIPSGWVSVIPPAPGSDAARCANYASDAWDVALTTDGSTLLVSPAAGERRVDTMRVGQDVLIGDDAGEFGGAIWQQIGSDKRDTLQVTGRDTSTFHADNLHAFVRRGDEVYAIVGLAHLSLDSGELLYLAPVGGRWKARTVLDLQSAPAAMVRVTNDTLLVLTSDSLLAVSLDPSRPTRHALVGNAVWSATYGSTLVRDRTGVLYIGMRSAVGRLRPDSQGFREDWLVPDHCRVRVLGRDDECSCKAPAN